MTPIVVVIGPYPPPEHGTSLPFLELVTHFKEFDHLKVVVVDTHSGDKGGMALLTPRVLFPGLRLAGAVLRATSGARYVVVYGSQRFCATFGIITAIICRLRRKTPACLYVQGGGFDSFFAGLSEVWRWSIRRSFCHYDRVFLQTTLLCNRLRPEIANVEKIPNWIAGRWIDSAPAAPSIPIDGQRCRRFMFLGEIREEKGIKVLCQAFAKLQDLVGVESKPELTIYGPIRPDFQASFSKLIAIGTPGVRYGGELSNASVREALWSHDVLVLPTFFPTEGYPGVILEAMSQRRLVIATRWRALPEIAIHGETALLCEPRSVDGLVEQLQESIDRPDDSRRMAEAGAARVIAQSTDRALAPMRQLVFAHCGDPTQ